MKRVLLFIASWAMFIGFISTMGVSLQMITNGDPIICIFGGMVASIASMLVCAVCVYNYIKTFKKKEIIDLY